MEKMFKCLATGSSGNCYLLNLGGGYILLDAGIPVLKIIDSINANDILFCCISHQHQDHKKSMGELMKRRVQVFYGGDNERTKSTKYKKHRIMQIPIWHGDCTNNAFIIEYDDECVLYATDFNKCDYDLSQFQFTRIIVECNYIESNIRVDDIKTKRQINTHMGLDGLKIFLDKLDLSKCHEIDLVHQSQQFGNGVIMGSTIYAKYKILTGVCKKFGGVAYYGRK